MQDDIRDILRKVRKYKEISIRKLASEINSSEDTIIRIENKRIWPNLKTLMSICDVLSCYIKIEHDLSKYEIDSDNYIQYDIRDTLRRVRKYNLITARELSDKINVSVNNIRSIETQRYNPTFEDVIKICDGLNCTIKLYID